VAIPWKCPHFQGIAKGAQLRLTGGVLVQQIGEPARPPLSHSTPDLLQLPRSHGDQLFTGLDQPFFRDLDLPNVIPPEEVGELAPH
jgi:hypothetical protein